MGIVLSAVVGAVGAVELVSVLHYISDEWLLHQLRTQNRDTLENALSKYQDEIRNSIAELGRRDSESVNYMQDGIAYENGFRQNDDPVNEELRLKFERRLKEILQESNIGAATTEELVSNGFGLIKGSSSSMGPPQIKSVVKGEMKHELVNENALNSNECEPVECVAPPHIQSDAVNKTIENQFEIIMPDNSETNEIVQSSSIINSSDVDTSVNDLEIKSECDYGVFNKDNSNENEKTDSATYPSIHFDEYDRPSQVDNDYLRTHDGVKQRPLVRDDGTGRRRAFKKRNSSSSLSQELKSSREEELKMFTSLEEAEFATMKHEFMPIKYSSEPNLASTSSSSSSSASPNNSIKPHRPRQKHRKISNTNIAEIDEEIDEIESKKVFSVDEIHNSDVIRPWGDIKPEARRGSDYINLQKQISIEEEPELNFDNSRNVTICDEFEEAETKSQYNEVINVLRNQNSKSEVDQYQPTDNRINNDQNVSTDEKNFPSASINANTPAIFAITNATTINITNNNSQATAAVSIEQTDKFDELTNRLQRIEEAIEQKITDWSKLPHLIHSDKMDEIADNSSDEEPDYSQRKQKRQQKLDYDQVEIDYQQILEDNDIDFNEDSSYLPQLENVRHFRVLDSDEEPHFKSRNSHISVSSDSENIDYDEGNKILRLRKHKRHDDRIYYESDEEPYYGCQIHQSKRKMGSSRINDNHVTVKHKRISDEMFDELSDTTDGIYTSTIVIGNEREFVLDSDEEPFSKSGNECTGAIAKFRKGQEHVITTITIPQLGLVRSYTYDSDEEPYYLEKPVSFDDQLHRSAIAEVNREDNVFDGDEYKQRLYDEYEIEENEESIILYPNCNDEHVYPWESDEEPYYDEKRLIREHQRRSKSPSRSPPIRPNNENILGMALTQNFLDLEREIEEEDRLTRSKIDDDVIHLGLLGKSRRNTRKQYEEITETSEAIVETTTRRKYKWEEKVASTITSYHRGEIKTAPSNDSNDDVAGNKDDHATESGDSHKTVNERELLVNIPSNDSNDFIGEINDEEVPNGAKCLGRKIANLSNNSDEDAMGGSDGTIDKLSPAIIHNVHDLMNDVNELSTDIKKFDTKQNNNVQEEKQINERLNCVLAEEGIGEADQELTTLGEELRKRETKLKDKKMRLIKKKKNIIEDSADFANIEHNNQNATVQSSIKILEDTKMFIATEAIESPSEGNTLSTSKFERTAVDNQLLLIEKEEIEQCEIGDKARVKTIKGNKTDIKPNNIAIPFSISEQQPNTSTESPEKNKKRQSVSRPDPLYLLKESMYPFY